MGGIFSLLAAFDLRDDVMDCFLAPKYFDEITLGEGVEGIF